MARLHYTLVKVPLDADIDADDTTIAFTAPLREFGEDDIATIAAPDTLTLRCAMEIMHVTAYTSGALTATVLRGQEGSTATAHDEGDILRHVLTADDFDEFGTATAAEVSIADAGAYFTGTDVEAALQELGAAAESIISDGDKGDITVSSSGTVWTIDNAARKEVLIVAVGDETTAITTGTAKVTFRMPFAMTLTAVRASLTTVSSSGTPTFDINEAGASILSTKLTIDASEKTSTTAATPAVISDASLADDAEITVDIDVAGTDAAGPKIYLIGNRT